MYEKTNVMRLMDRKKVVYESHDYTASGAVSGADVAKALGQDAACVFKTLVTVGKSGRHYVFMVPVCAELDLKKAAAAAGEKSVEMIPQKTLLPLTGYVHGGCSPIGMKKTFPTVIDASGMNCAAICFSAGKIGRQVQTSLSELRKILDFTCADVTV